ncbi:MAG: hypothetical protein ACYDA0_06380 [Candidatus Dormibacteraceae bacterium]
MNAIINQPIDDREVRWESAGGVRLSRDRRQGAVKIRRQEQLAWPNIAQLCQRRLQVASLDPCRPIAGTAKAD